MLTIGLKNNFISLIFAVFTVCLSNNLHASDFNRSSKLDDTSLNLKANNEILGQEGAQFFKHILKSSNLFAYLLALDGNVSQLSSQLKYVVLLNEIHTTNKNLSKILKELQENNHLLKLRIKQEGVRND